MNQMSFFDPIQLKTGIDMATLRVFVCHEGWKRIRVHVWISLSLETTHTHTHTHSIKKVLLRGSTFAIRKHLDS